MNHISLVPSLVGDIYYAVLYKKVHTRGPRLSVSVLICQFEQGSIGGNHFIMLFPANTQHFYSMHKEELVLKGDSVVAVLAARWLVRVQRSGHRLQCRMPRELTTKRMNGFMNLFVKEHSRKQKPQMSLPDKSSAAT
jgi:hypothetical protein